jgi:hypothetical protein
MIVHESARMPENYFLGVCPLGRAKKYLFPKNNNQCT